MGNILLESIFNSNFFEKKSFYVTKFKKTANFSFLIAGLKTCIKPHIIHTKALQFTFEIHIHKHSVSFENLETYTQMVKPNFALHNIQCGRLQTAYIKIHCPTPYLPRPLNG